MSLLRRLAAPKVLLVVALLFALNAAVLAFGNVTVNDELDCGSWMRPHAPTSFDGVIDGGPDGLRDAALCRRAIAEQRPRTATAISLSALALVAAMIVWHGRRQSNDR